MHFQATTPNKHTYEPACCVVSSTYVTKLLFCPTIRSSLATPLITQLLCNGRDYESLQFVITQFFLRCYGVITSNHNYKTLTFCSLPYMELHLISTYVGVSTHTYC